MKLREVAGAAVFWIVVFIGMLGCDVPSSITDPMERQEEALAIVWGSAFGKTDAPPTIRWVMGAELDCVEPNGNRGFMVRTVEGRGCKGGITFTGYTVYVAWPPGSAYSDTAMAHELKHADQLRRGINDPFHIEEGAWENVDQANEMLINAGL